MQAWEGVLSEADIDNVTAYIRSKADGWTDGGMPLRPLPTPDEYLLNPENENPEWGELIDGRYITSEQLYQAIQEEKRMVMLDTRVVSVWQRAHIEGSVPFPYYSDMESKVNELPRDAQVVAYCSCPRAAADHVVDKLAELGFTNTVVLYEGIFGWMNKGYPVTRSE